MQFKDAATIDKIRDRLALMEKKVLQTEVTLHQVRYMAETALEVQIGQQLIGYIDSGMSVEQFVLKTLEFCTNNISMADAIQLRASYTIALVEGWGQEVSDD